MAVLLSLLSFFVHVISSTSDHSNNWAVLVGASRYWFNYRHIANVLSIYHSIKRMGVPDSQIILMIADDMACNDRNHFKAQMRASHMDNIYDNDVEVDYRGEECSVENLLKLLTNRVDDNLAINKRLLTNSQSNILLYLTGHGGNTFLKFHDKEEIQSQDLSDALNIMFAQKRYNEILFMIDTCQAATLYADISAPNVIGIGSSKKDQSSYSYYNDHSLGISLVDRFTHHTLNFFERGIKTSNSTLLSLFESFTYEKLHSDAEWKFINFDRNQADVKITDFFSAVSSVDLVKESVDLSEEKSEEREDEKVQSLLINKNEHHRHQNGNEDGGMSILNEWFDGLASMSRYQLFFVVGSIFVCLFSVEMNYIHRQ